MIKPFKFDNLKKMTQREIDLTRALYEYLPATSVREDLQLAIRKTLMKHLGQDIRYFISSVDWINYGDFAQALPDVPVVSVFGLTPIDQKAILSVDHHIANMMINKLLGGGDLTVSEIKALTETEQGVLQYLIMQVLSQIYKLTGSEPRVHFRFEKFMFQSEEIARMVSPDQKVCCMTIEVGMQDQSGFIKIIFPDPFLEGMARTSKVSGKTKKEKDYLLGEIQKWGFIKTAVWAKAGHSVLSPVEINELEKGDVILFDEIDLNIVDDNISGNVTLHFGASERSAVAEIVDVGKRKIKCKINEIDKG